MKTDILKNELYIREFAGAWRGYIPTRYIPPCHPRKSDGFIFIEEGECLYTFSDGKQLTAHRGDVLYLADGSVYAMKITCPRYAYTYCNFYFACESPRESTVVALSDAEQTSSLFSRLLRFALREDKGSRAEAIAVLYRIYAALLRTAANCYLPSSSRARIVGARNRILTDFADKGLTVAELARESGLSEVQFRKLFVRAYGVSPGDFIISTRLAHAKELLALNCHTTEEIAEQSGFSSATYFCRVFKARTSMTTREYKAERGI